MKKIVILILGLFTVACSNDDATYSDYTNRDIPLDPNTAISYTITQNIYSYQNAYPSQVNKLYFSGEKLILYQNSDGSYSKYKYTDNLLSEIENYNSRNIAISRAKFLYDNLGRIIEIDEMPFLDQNIQIIKSAIVYNTDKITVNQSFITPTVPIETRTYEFKLNSNNEIIQNHFAKWDDITPNGAYLYKYDYENGNLVKKNLFDMTYSYTSIKNDYSYKKYLFGKEWKKNNFIINLIPSNLMKASIYESEVSENLISYMKYTLPTIPKIEYTMEANYEFNIQNKMIKEIRKYSQTINGETKNVERSEFIYEYK